MQLSEQHRQHKKNLKKLSKYLHNLPDNYEHFHMAEYCNAGTGSVREATKENITECGTTACALGHGPAAGIKPSLHCNDWTVYSEDKFGLNTYGNAWDWCFGPRWKKTDNTPKGAAKRIMYMLEYGVPSYHDFNPAIYADFKLKFRRGGSNATN